MKIPVFATEHPNRFWQGCLPLQHARILPITTESLTPDQQDLDHRLREWRKSESEKLGLPQFFVFGSSTLRSLVLTRPKTLAQLQTISGINPEKLDRYGAGILAVCNA